MQAAVSPGAEATSPLPGRSGRQDPCWSPEKTGALTKLSEWYVLKDLEYILKNTYDVQLTKIGSTKSIFSAMPVKIIITKSHSGGSLVQIPIEAVIYRGIVCLLNLPYLLVELTFLCYKR